MLEANDSIFIIPGEGLFCYVRSKTIEGYYSARGLESLILRERQHGRDTEELEYKLFTLRRYNREVIRPPVEPPDWAAVYAGAGAGRPEGPA